MGSRANDGGLSEGLVRGSAAKVGYWSCSCRPPLWRPTIWCRTSESLVMVRACGKGKQTGREYDDSEESVTSSTAKDHRRS
jgi:hypothetical protein